MEQQYCENLEQHLSEIAHHYVRALPSGDANKAVDFAWRAGRRAFEQLAFEDGARLLGMAVEASNLTPMDEPRLCELLIDCGDAQIGGRVRVLPCDVRACGGDSAPAGELLARAILGYGLLSSGPAKMDRNMVALLNEALALGKQDSALRVGVLELLVEELLWLGKEDRLCALSDEALAITPVKVSIAPLRGKLSDLPDYFVDLGGRRDRPRRHRSRLGVAPKGLGRVSAIAAGGPAWRELPKVAPS